MSNKSDFAKSLGMKLGIEGNFERKKSVITGDKGRDLHNPWQDDRVVGTELSKKERLKL